jgi:hypothetical protein
MDKEKKAEGKKGSLPPITIIKNRKTLRENYLD